MAARGSRGREQRVELREGRWGIAGPVEVGVVAGGRRRLVPARTAPPAAHEGRACRVGRGGGRDAVTVPASAGAGTVATAPKTPSRPRRSRTPAGPEAREDGGADGFASIGSQQ